MKTKKCRKCGNEFNLYRFGAPGDPTRDICWNCKPPYYAPATKRSTTGWDELDALEDRCVRDLED